MANDNFHHQNCGCPIHRPDTSLSNATFQIVEFRIKELERQAREWREEAERYYKECKKLLEVT